MSTRGNTSAGNELDVGPGRLWFGLLGGAFAWLAHLMIAYTVAEFGCVAGLGEYRAVGISVVAWIVLVLSAVTLIIAVVATFAAYRAHVELVGRVGAETQGKVYAARAGWITSGLFALVILVESVPIFFYLREC